MYENVYISKMHRSGMQRCGNKIVNKCPFPNLKSLADKNSKSVYFSNNHSSILIKSDVMYDIYIWQYLEEDKMKCYYAAFSNMT